MYTVLLFCGISFLFYMQQTPHSLLLSVRHVLFFFFEFKVTRIIFCFFMTWHISICTANVPGNLKKKKPPFNFLLSIELFLKQDVGWGLLSQFPLFRYFPNFSSLSKNTLTVTYSVYIWQVLPQLSCGDTCQILMWFEESNMYFCKIENFAYGEINEQSFSNPHPSAGFLNVKTFA